MGTVARLVVSMLRVQILEGGMYLGRILENLWFDGEVDEMWFPTEDLASCTTILSLEIRGKRPCVPSEPDGEPAK